MRSPWMMIAAFAALALTGYAAWLAMDGAPPRSHPASDPESAAPTPRPTPRLANGNAREAPPATADAKSTSEARPTLGDSQDPRRLSQANAIYDRSLAELRALQAPDPERAAALFLEAKSAIERMEDELPPDDPRARAELDHKLRVLRDELRRLGAR